MLVELAVLGLSAMAVVGLVAKIYQDRVRDSWLGRIGLVGYILLFALYGAVNKSWAMHICTAAGLLAGVGQPALRAHAAKRAGSASHHHLFAWLAMLDAIGSFFSGIILFK